MCLACQLCLCSVFRLVDCILVALILLSLTVCSPSFFSLSLFANHTSKAMSDPANSLSQILAALEQLQAENATLCQSLLELQFATSSVTPTIILNPPQPYQEPYYEPKVNLPDKFDGTLSRKYPAIRGKASRTCVNGGLQRYTRTRVMYIIQ